MPSPDPVLSPRQVAKAGLCIGCGACAAHARQAGADMGFDLYGQLKPAGPADWRKRRSEATARTCPFSPSAADEDELSTERYADAAFIDSHIGRYEAAYVGHVAEQDFRAQGSSGGLVTWTAVELLRRGLVDGVAHVGAVDPTAGGPLFRYRISRTEQEIRQGAKSRYYPVELSGVIDEIRSRPGRYAVIGAPCFIKAVHLSRREDPVLHERIVFTLGLFCGHMKSARMVESFAWQMGRRSEDVAAIDFRHKSADRPANWYTARIVLRDGGEQRKDWWSMVDGDWGAGFFQNSACNFCDDVAAETADVAFGDAWVEPYSSDARGTNVVVIRSKAIAALVRQAKAEGRLALEPVDAGFVYATQAAGFRHRREGLSLRLAERGDRGLKVHKRTPALRRPATPRRRTVYRLRALISAWSHRLFLVARLIGRPGLYTRCARGALTVYQAVAWSQGRLGEWLDRLETRFGRRHGI
jgi:coenzyme F420-reducing hydrogenase beta subunit